MKIRGKLTKPSRAILKPEVNSFPTGFSEVLKVCILFQMYDTIKCSSYSNKNLYKGGGSNVYKERRLNKGSYGRSFYWLCIGLGKVKLPEITPLFFCG